MNDSQPKTNPYQSPTPSAAATDLKPQTLRPATQMFIRHSIFMVLVGAGIVFVATAIDRYAFSGVFPKLSSPTLLALHIGRTLVRNWYFGLLAAPFYFLFLVALHSADHKIRGIRYAWPLIFWTLGAVFLVLICFGFLLPFL